MLRIYQNFQTINLKMLYQCGYKQKTQSDSCIEGIQVVEAKVEKKISCIKYHKTQKGNFIAITYALALDRIK